MSADGKEELGCAAMILATLVGIALIMFVSHCV